VLFYITVFSFLKTKNFPNEKKAILLFLIGWLFVCCLSFVFYHYITGLIRDSKALFIPVLHYLDKININDVTIDFINSTPYLRNEWVFFTRRFYHEEWFTIFLKFLDIINLLCMYVAFIYVKNSSP